MLVILFSYNMTDICKTYTLNLMLINQIKKLSNGLNQNIIQGGNN